MAGKKEHGVLPAAELIASAKRARRVDVEGLRRDLDAVVDQTYVRGASGHELVLPSRTTDDD